MLDRNHNYGSLAKEMARHAVLTTFKRYVVQSKKHRCITLPSCYDGNKAVPSRDLMQWADAFSESQFIGVNTDTRTCAAFRKFHPKAQIWQGDAYPIFAKLASQHTGLYFLDSTNSLTDMLASSSVLIDKRWEWLWCFGYNARPNTFLAYNLTFDRPRIGGHIQNYTYGEVDKQVNRFKKELMDCLGKGWEMAEVYQYRSTHHSAMITFMCYKR